VYPEEKLDIESLYPCKRLNISSKFTPEKDQVYRNRTWGSFSQ